MAPNITFKRKRKLRRTKSYRMPKSAQRGGKLVQLTYDYNADEKRLTWVVPLKLVSPNVQLSWNARYSLNSRIKKKLLMLMPCEIKNVDLPCSITLIRIGPRKMDFDNMVFSCKVARDVISDYLRPGLAPGYADGDENIMRFFYEQENLHDRSYGLKVIFEWNEKIRKDNFKDRSNINE